MIKPNQLRIDCYVVHDLINVEIIRFELISPQHHAGSFALVKLHSLLGGFALYVSENPSSNLNPTTKGYEYATYKACQTYIYLAAA